MSMDGHNSDRSTFETESAVKQAAVRNQKNCNGQCNLEALAAFDLAAAAVQTLGQLALDVAQRFEFLYDVCGTDRHQEAEIRREHTIALYEAMYGQEDPQVAAALLDLAALYTAHGNSTSAEYITSWANEIMNAPKDEPLHEFFHLFGYNDPEQHPEQLPQQLY